MKGSEFFVLTANGLVPVEVKGERGVGRSLRTLVASDHYRDIRWGIKLHAGNAGRDGKVLTLPYWCAFLFSRILLDGDALAQLGLG